MIWLLETLGAENNDPMRYFTNYECFPLKAAVPSIVILTHMSQVRQYKVQTKYKSTVLNMPYAVVVFGRSLLRRNSVLHPTHIVLLINN